MRGWEGRIVRGVWYGRGRRWRMGLGGEELKDVEMMRGKRWMGDQGLILQFGQSILRKVE